MEVPQYWREIDERYRLAASRCGACGRVHFPRRVLCTRCRHASVGRMEPMQLSGKARLLHWTVVHDGARGSEALVPYVIGFVETEEGCRVTSRIVDTAHEDLLEGMQLELRYRLIGDGGPAGVIHYGYAFGPPVA